MSLYQVTLILRQFINLSLKGGAGFSWHTGAAVTHFQLTVWFKSVNLVNFNTGFPAFRAFLLGRKIPGIMELTVTKAQAIVDLHVATMNKVAPTPCLEPIVIEPVIDQPFIALNEDLLSIQTAPQLQDLVDKLGLEYNPGALCKGEVSKVFCSFRLCCLLSFFITDHALVA
ncbi:hypothetical protein DSO57_1036327 [Entomophthora muscae]|uniref:Uncharacterized protein n=1 Tax=Entomophthora muscae TaxID=34485 RepID=A0ACC2TX59_9FUNG|nr:hypothetical protein DSO57_1036327 [Entomophthora muscae]